MGCLCSSRTFTVQLMDKKEKEYKIDDWDKCDCCKKLIVVQTNGMWHCWYCSIKNKTEWRCTRCGPLN
jgi:hypothetical protein